ncbi:MAG: hypothetical protein WCO07_00710 [bacterium]
MKLNFIFSNLNTIVLVIWILFLIIVAIRFFRPAWVRNISFLKLIIVSFVINLLYGAFVTWGQYYVWATVGDFTRVFVNSPLPKQVPMPQLLEWTRPFFENNFGYFLYYVLGRVWLYVFISFLVSVILYFLFKIWKSYRGNFTEYGPELILILMLIVGWPGVIIFIPLGFLFSIILSFVYYLKGKKVTEIEPAFIVAALFTLIFGKIILNFL